MQNDDGSTSSLFGGRFLWLADEENDCRDDEGDADEDGEYYMNARIDEPTA